jgi:predicted ATPase
LTPLVGREREEAAIARVLRQEEVRLLALMGPTGVGMTRLATQTAWDHGDCFANVIFVSLAAISAHSLVLPEIAQALGLHEYSDQSVMEQLSAYLSRRELLLVLDNFEHVAQSRPELTRLLAAFPRVRALLTSRIALRVRGGAGVSGAAA